MVLLKVADREFSPQVRAVRERALGAADGRLAGTRPRPESRTQTSSLGRGGWRAALSAAPCEGLLPNRVRRALARCIEICTHCL